MYQIREANQMVEEFMLAANISVAEKILKHFPMCSLLRYITCLSFTGCIKFSCPGLQLEHQEQRLVLMLYFASPLAEHAS